MKVVLIFLLLVLFSVAGVIKPTKIYHISGNTVDFTVSDNRLYVGSDAGKVEVFDVGSKKKLFQIELKEIKTFSQDMKPPKVFSVDVAGSKILLLSEAKGGSRDLFVYENKKLKHILNSHDMKISIREARFLNDKQIFFGITGGEYMLYDLEKKESLYHESFSGSTFSDFAFNNDKSEAALTSESGEVVIVNARTGEISKRLSGINRDNIYKLDYKNGVILTGGQDRRCGIYKGYGKSFIEADFLIYAVGLSPSGKTGAFAKTEDSIISVVDIGSKDELYRLKGHKSTINTIIFTSETTIFSSSDDKEVIMWKLK